MDAQVSYAFHSERKLHPEKFRHQLVNQVLLLSFGTWCHLNFPTCGLFLCSEVAYKVSWHVKYGYIIKDSPATNGIPIMWMFVQFYLFIYASYWWSFCFLFVQLLLFEIFSDSPFSLFTICLENLWKACM